MEKTYTIYCDICGTKSDNSNDTHCDVCGEKVRRVQIDGVWYDVEELEKMN